MSQSIRIDGDVVRDTPRATRGRARKVYADGKSAEPAAPTAASGPAGASGTAGAPAGRQFVNPDSIPGRSGDGNNGDGTAEQPRRGRPPGPAVKARKIPFNVN